MKNNDDLFGKVTAFDEEGAHKLASRNSKMMHTDIISSYTMHLLEEKQESCYPYIFGRLRQGDAENLMICRLHNALFVDLIPERDNSAAYLLVPEKMSEALYNNIMEYKDEIAAYEDLTVVSIKELDEPLDNDYFFQESFVGEDDATNMERLNLLANYVEKPLRK